MTSKTHLNKPNEMDRKRYKKSDLGKTENLRTKRSAPRLLTCSRHQNLQNIRIPILQIFVLILFNDSVPNNLRQILD